MPGSTCRAFCWEEIRSLCSPRSDPRPCCSSLHFSTVCLVYFSCPVRPARAHSHVSSQLTFSSPFGIAGIRVPVILASQQRLSRTPAPRWEGRPLCSQGLPRHQPRGLRLSFILKDELLCIQSGRADAFLSACLHLKQKHVLVPTRSRPPQPCTHAWGVTREI